MTPHPTTELGFVHRIVEGARERPLLLLHGTGGDENDLVALGQRLAPGAALLSPRGQVLEHGMPRFFRRFAEGRFDHEDVRRRANELAEFVLAARERYRLAAPIALGFSNGANIAAALLYLRPVVLGGAVLIRAMTPLPEDPRPIAGRTPVLILSGSADPIVPSFDADHLAERLAEAGAQVRHEVLQAGHQLTQADLANTEAWLAAQSVQQPQSATA
jgi:phospholipase/carboxylesterase